MSDIFPEDDDRCVDPIDQGCKTEQVMRANSVALARARSAPEQTQLPVLDEAGKPCLDEAGAPLMYWPVTECVDCGDDILPARLAMARIRCVICQEAIEKRRKLHGAT